MKNIHRMFYGCFDSSFSHVFVIAGRTQLGLEVGIRPIKDFVKKILPTCFLVLFCVDCLPERFHEFTKTPCFNHSIHKGKWTCVPLIQQVHKQKVTYLNNFETTLIKSRNSSFLTKSMTISVNSANDRFLTWSIVRLEV